MKKEKPYTISRLQNVKEEVYYVHKTGRVGNNRTKVRS